MSHSDRRYNHLESERNGDRSHSLSGYAASASSPPSSTRSSQPPSYEEIERERKQRFSHSSSSVSPRSPKHMENRRTTPRSPNASVAASVSSRKSVNTSPLRLSGLSNAFSSKTIPTQAIAISADETDAYTTDLLPTGGDKYKPPTVEVNGIDNGVVSIDNGRDAWGNKAEFILASIGLAVGLGNVWRFPYLCQNNGGGAFLIPYFIMMIIEGIPLFYIEFAIGQRFKRSAIGCWKKIHPSLIGVGISCIVISMMLCIYYIVIISWSFYYLFVSFTDKLPWSPEKCSGYEQYKSYVDACARNSSDTFNCIQKVNFAKCCVHDAPLFYFYREALDISQSIESSGSGMNGKLVGCLIVAWVIVYACIVKGVKSSGKAVYFTATFPYIILIILFFVGVTLEGAGTGLKKLFYPDFSRLKDPKIWMDAATQMFFTLSLGFGALISFASYMPIKNNCVRDAYTVVLINCGTSIFAGIVVFSILGHREHVTGIPVESTGNGPGLAFITFCDAFLQMPVSPLWSILFFIMLILLGIDSEFGTLEGLITPFYDMKWVKMRKEIFTGIVVILMFFLGLSLVSSQGYYVFQMFDDFSVNLPLLFIAFFQVVAISWVYGTEKFANDIEYMTGSRPFIFWMICWKYISPLAILIIFTANCYNLIAASPKYKAYVGCIQQLVDFSSKSPGTKDSLTSYEYPGWCKFFIFVFVTCSMIPIIVFLVKDLIQNPKKWLDSFIKKLTNPVEYHPDPSMVDLSRRKTGHEMDIEILKEMEENDA